MFGCGAAVSPDDGGFKGINKNRKCTDVLCLLIFLVFCAAGAGVGIFAIGAGQPESLVFGKDDNGNICSSKNTQKPPKCQAEQCFWADGKQRKDTNKDGEEVGEPKWAHVDGKDVEMGIDYELKKYVVYPRLVEDLFDAAQQTPPVAPLQVEFFGICIDKCPTTAGWTCSPYGMGYLADTLAMTTFPPTLSDTDCVGCKSTLDDCRDNGIFNPTMPVTMHKYKSEKCSKLLKACFYSSLQHTDTMFRCFPMYQQNVSYACDDNNDGKPDEEFLGLDGKPMNGEWQAEPFNDDQKTMCGTMIKRSLSQQSASPNIVYEQIASAVAVIGRMIADLRAGISSIVICGIFIAVICGFLWLILLRYCARVFVWLTIVLVIVMEASLCVFFYIQAGMIDVTVPSDAPAPGTTSGAVMPTELANDGDTNVEMFKWAAIGMSILLVVQFMGVIAAIKKINVAAEIISEASKAVAAMKGLMLFPVFPVIIISGIFMWFIYVGRF
jgi:choline transporter-like protein 2/4/5